MTDSLTALKKHYKLNDSIKNYKGYKVKSPEETINRIKNAFKKIDLKVKYLPKKELLVEKKYPFSTGNAILTPSDDEKVILLQSCGKGVSSILSEASATAELIERFSGYGLVSGGNINYYLSRMKCEQIWRNKKIEFISSYLHFNSLDTIDYIPNNLKNNYDKLVKGICYSLTDKKLYTYPEEFITKIQGSNGLASGNTFEEATLHAIFELVERLGGMYFLDNLPNVKKISKSSITHPTLKKLIKSITEAGMKFEMFDLSFLFNIPLIVTIFDHPKWNLQTNSLTKCNVQYPKIIIGVDTNPQDAAMRCFTELIQEAEPINLSKSIEKEILRQYKRSKLSVPISQKQNLRTSNCAFINGSIPVSIDARKYLNSKHEEITIDKLPDLYDVNQKNEIKRIVKELKKHNFEVFIHDLTNPVLEFPVVRAVLKGGNGYFKKIPVNGYAKIILDADSKRSRYLRLNKIINMILTKNPLHQILKEEEWIYGINQKKLVKIAIFNLYLKGPNSSLWGVPINKLYFIGMLYLNMNRYKNAENCFNAALIKNPEHIPSLLSLAYIYYKKNRQKEFQKITKNIKNITKNSINIKKEMHEFENNVITPNPFEICDFNCKKKNRPHLCENCYFNYVSEDKFMKKITDEMILIL